MTAKGNKTCCCNGCEEPPQPNSGSLTEAERKSWQTHCCACLPEFACLVVVKRGTPDIYDAIDYRLYCPPTAIGPQDPVYMPATTNGTFIVDGVEIDVAIHFLITDGVCQLCIRSTALGIDENTYGACTTIDDAARATPNFFCSRLSDSDIEQDYATDRYLGTVDPPSGVGTLLTAGGYDFILSRADHIAITPRPNCIDSYGTQVIDTSPIKNFCCNCGCICRCACLTKSSVSGSYGEVACLNDLNQWEVASGAIVSLHTTSYSRTCYLRLTPDNPLGTDPADVLISAEANPCPRPTAEWASVVPTSTYFAAHSEWYTFTCVRCGDNGCTVELAGCCSDGRTSFPKLLYADVTTTCPDCPAFTVTLVWDQTMSVWEGVAKMCGHDITLTIGCPFTTLAFSASPCTSASPSATGTPTCSPILAAFSFTTGGIGCCGGSSVLTPTITVTVYE